MSFKAFCKMRPHEVRTIQQMPLHGCKCEYCQNLGILQEKLIGIGICGIPKNHACSIEVTWCPFQKKPIQISNYCNGKSNEKCAEKMAVLLESDEKCAENSVQPLSDVNLTITCDEKRSQHYDNCDDKSDEKCDQPQIDVEVLIPHDEKRFSA